MKERTYKNNTGWIDKLLESDCDAQEKTSAKKKKSKVDKTRADVFISGTNCL